MNRQAFTYLLEHPETITVSETVDIRALLDQFPFFQSAQALYLKGLKNQESFSYNKALKVTAAHTTDRAILFDYITSPLFKQNAISQHIKHQEIYLHNLEVYELQDVSTQVAEEGMAQATKILDPDLFIKEETTESLQLGKPLSFDHNETHSFSQWLQITAFKPIDRSDGSPLLKKSETTLPPKDVLPEKEKPNSLASKERKQQIIDSFIKANPKIDVHSIKTPSQKNLAKERSTSTEALMTETLARVYIEQKKYKKAKQAYRILSLKYPEKSGFFADRIRAVEQLEAAKES